VVTPTVPHDLRFAWVNVNTPDELHHLECMTNLPKALGQTEQGRAIPFAGMKNMSAPVG